MKQIKLLALSLFPLLFARQPGFCTANSQAEGDTPTPSDRVEAAVHGQPLHAQPSSLPIAEDHSPLAALARGRGLTSLDDVRWRVQAGLTHAQAIEAALSQAAEDKRVQEEAAAKAAKPAKPVAR